MRVDGEGTFVVGRSLNVQLSRGADAYRERALVPYGAGAVARVEVVAGPSRYALERVGSTFRTGDTRGLRVSRAAVDRLFTALADARAESFVDDVTADRATENPSLVVRVTLRNGDPLRLRVGEPCPSGSDTVTVVRDAPARSSACVPRSALDPLRVSPDALIDTAPFYARPDEIEELTLEPSGTESPRVDLARRGAGWHERSPEDRELDSDATDSANALAGALSNARALEARAPRAGETVPPHARISIVRTGDGEREIIEVGPPGADGTAPARRLDDGAILRIDRAAVHRFAPHPIALRTRSVWRTPFDTASVAGIDDTCGAEPSQLQLVSGSWTTRKPHGIAANSAAIDYFVSLLAHARADSWVAEGDDGTFGLSGAGACGVTLTLQEPPGADGGAPGAARRVGVLFGSKAEGGLYARTLDDPAVFVAPAALQEIKTPEPRPARSPATGSFAPP
jgi:hypothetical protein